VELFGQAIELDPQTFNSVGQVLGLQLALPSQLMVPEQIATLEQADVNQLTLSLDEGAAWIWLNELQSPRLKLHLETAELLLPPDYGPAFGLLSQILKVVPGTVYVRFTPEPFARPDQEMVEAMGDVMAVNTVQLDATISPTGEVLSAGGFTTEEAALFNLQVWDVDPNVAAMLATFDKISVDASSQKLMLTTNDRPAVELFWDQDGRQMLLDTTQKFVPGLSLDNPQFAPIMDLAETWLKTSHVNVDLFIDDTPQDALPSVKMGEPLQVAFNGSALNVAGMDVPLYGVDLGLIKDTVRAYGVENAQLCWQGDELRWLINGLELPYVSADDGWLIKAIETAGWQAHPIALKLEKILSETNLPVAVATSPEMLAPVKECGAYMAARAAEPSLAFSVDATWHPDDAVLELHDVGLPFAALGLFPLDISAQIGLPPEVAVFVPRTLGDVKANLGADGLYATVDGIDAAIHWDARLLSNLAEVTDAIGVGPTIRQAMPVLNMAEVSVDFASTSGVAAYD
jgi:hypothetical protein